MGDITQTDLIYAFTGAPGDHDRTPTIEALLERLEIGLKALQEDQAQDMSDRRRSVQAANVLRGSLLRFAQFLGDPVVAARVGEIIELTAKISGI